MRIFRNDSWEWVYVCILGTRCWWSANFCWYSCIGLFYIPLNANNIQMYPSMSTEDIDCVCIRVCMRVCEYASMRVCECRNIQLAAETNTRLLHRKRILPIEFIGRMCQCAPICIRIISKYVLHCRIKFYWNCEWNRMLIVGRVLWSNEFE